MVDYINNTKTYREELSQIENLMEKSKGVSSDIINEKIDDLFNRIQSLANKAEEEVANKVISPKDSAIPELKRLMDRIQEIQSTKFHAVEEETGRVFARFLERVENKITGLIRGMVFWGYGQKLGVQAVQKK